jgi:DNA-binding XRE family transcriptional regulator
MSLKPFKPIGVEWSCSGCFSQKVQRASHKENLKFGDYVFVAEVPATKCLDCGQTLSAPGALDVMAGRIVQEFLRAGDFNATALRIMRSLLRLKAVQMATLLGVRPETISRWETGRWPISRPAAIALGSLFADFLEGRETTRNLIQALQAPRPVPKSLNLGKIQPPT